MTTQKICLDPGHGGTDSGASNGPIREKHINLLLGYRLKYLLEQAGIEVLMARIGDEFVSLNDRVKKSNDWEAGLFISLHCNDFKDKAVTGIETWHYQQPLLAQKTQECLIAAFPDHKDRGIKRCSGYQGQNPSPDGGPLEVLICTYCPAILVEVEFLSNDNMRDWLCMESTRRMVASAIAKSIL